MQPVTEDLITEEVLEDMVRVSAAARGEDPVWGKAVAREEDPARGEDPAWGEDPAALPIKPTGFPSELFLIFFLFFT
ncbi:MAG: hypothetical protein KAT15_23960 [Bacteroidales bacterium]|nr:hypothetical protein [Bacteroidales bacterium]